MQMVAMAETMVLYLGFIWYTFMNNDILVHM